MRIAKFLCSYCGVSWIVKYEYYYEVKGLKCRTCGGEDLEHKEIEVVDYYKNETKKNK